MDGRIALLGRPRIERQGHGVPLAGRKPWGLLAYLCLEHQATRHDLAGLFSTADDPLAALRWSLLQVRRALTGLAFDDEPGFDNWLLLQRSRVGAAVAEAHAWAASALAASDPDAALDLIGLATRADPFNDSLYELAVEIHMTRGDRAAAEALVRHVTGLYRRDLGAPTPDRIRRPLDRPRRPADHARNRRPGTARGRPGEVRRRRLPGRAGDGPGAARPGPLQTPTQTGGR